LQSSTKPPSAAPWAAKKLTVTFPTGTKFALGSVKACTLSDSAIKSGKTCPAASKIGSGSASAEAVQNNTGMLSVNGTVSAYVAGAGKMILVVKSTVGKTTQTVVIHETTSGNVLQISVPALKVMGYNVVLTKLQLTVPSKGTGRSSLIKAGRCTNNQWTVKTHFVYTNGQTKNVTTRGGFCT
jgi:hypothetical protein